MELILTNFALRHGILVKVHWQKALFLGGRTRGSRWTHDCRWCNGKRSDEVLCHDEAMQARSVDVSTHYQAALLTKLSDTAVNNDVPESSQGRSTSNCEDKQRQ